MRRRIAADRRYRGGRLQCRLARAEGLQRRRDPGQGRGADASPGRAARRSRRQPQPLYRGRGRRRHRRVHLPAQRQSDRHREVRLQAPLDGPAARARARRSLAEERPAVLAGDFNVIPEDRDTFSRPGDGRTTRCSSRKARPPSAGSSTRAGPTRCGRSIPTRSGSTPSGTIPPAPGRATRASASTICSARRRPPTGCAAPTSTNGRGARKRPPTTRRPWHRAQPRVALS